MGRLLATYYLPTYLLTYVQPGIIVNTLFYYNRALFFLSLCFISLLFILSCPDLSLQNISLI